MDTTKQATQSQTTQSQTTQSQFIDIDWMFQDRDEDFDLIDFGIASNGGRLSITQHK
jgi:hypothetical protein